MGHSPFSIPETVWADKSLFLGSVSYNVIDKIPYCFLPDRKTNKFDFCTGKWDPKSYDFDEAACASMLLFSYVVGQSAETQRKGIVFVHDLSGFGMQHVKAIKASRLKQLVGLMQVIV